MLLIGYFEGIGSQREIAWRCSDSLTLREFLGLDYSERVPDHSSMTRFRHRIPGEVFQGVFLKFIEMAREMGVSKGGRCMWTRPASKPTHP